MSLVDRVLLLRADEQCRGSRLPPDGRDNWAIGRARMKPGPKTGHSRLRKLTDEQVRRIRKARSEGESHERLAKRFCMGKGAIQAICDRKTYREVA